MLEAMRNALAKIDAALDVRCIVQAPVTGQGLSPAGWWIRVTSMPLTTSPETLSLFAEALEDDAALQSASATLDGEGRLSANMTVDEPRQGHATEIVIAAFYRGLEAAGFRTNMPGWELEVEVIAPLSG
jgi:hypothetical protein